MTENLRSAAHFRREAETITLPSGKDVEVRRPDVAAMIMAQADSGDIPQPLVDQMLMSLNTGQRVEARLEYEAAHLPGLYRFQCLVTRAALAWPTIVPDGVEPDYEAGEIAISDLDTADLGYVTQWVMGRAAAAASRFPEAEAASVGPASPGGAVRSKAKRTARNK